MKNSDATSGTNFCTSSARFAPSFVRQPNGPEYTQIVKNVILGSDGVLQVRLLRKIPTRLRGTNFCTSSARFAPSFVRQPNGTECTQVVRNATKCQFRVRWGVSGAFVAKNSDATSWHVLLHKFGRFAPSFLRQPNSPECTQNSTKRNRTSV